MVAVLAVTAAVLLSPTRLKPIAERRLSASLGLPVRIGSLSRAGGGPLHPRYEASDVTIGQAAWTRSAAPLVHLDRVMIATALPALLRGAPPVAGVTIAGGQAALVRARDGQRNWTDREATRGGDGGNGGSPPPLTVRDLHLTFDDRRRDRAINVVVAADPAAGVRAEGSATLRGSPARVQASARPDGGFTARVTGPTLDARAEGRSERPYAFGRFAGTLVASGRDLRDLDAIAEAGLPGSRRFAIRAGIAHAPRHWAITGLTGTIGRSTIDGAMTVNKRDGRTILDGRVHAAALDFDDLAGDDQRARGVAERRRVGPRVVPGTKIALDHLQKTDGTVAVRIDRLLWADPAPFRSLAAQVMLDHGALTLSSLRVGMTHGAMRGTVAVIQRGERAPTRLALDLRLKDGRIEDLVGGTVVTAPLDAHLRLAGNGRTVRDAVARGGGKIALATGPGLISHRVAELLGRNVGRALKAGADERVGLRCLIADFEGRGGRFAPNPLIVDTAVARAEGHGLLDMDGERLAMTVTGASKVPAAFRLSGPLEVDGTLKAPHPRPAAVATSRLGVLRSLGRAFGSGSKEQAATDADCAGLRRAGLR